MKPTLVIGLGSPLAGDDGVGWHVAGRLATHARLPSHIEVIQGGTDLLRHADDLCGRDRVFLVDALLDDGPVGRIVRFDDVSVLDDGGSSAHQLSPILVLRILRAACPEIQDVPITFLGVTIREVGVGERLSPELESRLDHLVDHLRAIIAAPEPA